jgi:hypothetical protein
MACVLLDHWLMDRGQTGGVRGQVGQAGVTPGGAHSCRTIASPGM